MFNKGALFGAFENYSEYLLWCVCMYSEYDITLTMIMITLTMIVSLG